MNYRPLGLLTGALSLIFVVACGGGDSDTNPEPTAPATGPTSEASVEVPAGPTGPAAQSMTEGITQDPVAIVNGQEIPLSDLEVQLSQLEATYQQQGVPLPGGAELAQVQQQVLGRLVQQTLVLQESDARGIVAEDAEIQAQYDEARASFPDEQAFEDTLAAEGITTEDIRELIEQNIKIEKLLTAVIEEADLGAPTDEEVQQLYDIASQQQDLPPLEEIRAQIETELVTQRENEVLQAFVQELEASGDVQILITS